MRACKSSGSTPWPGNGAPTCSPTRFNQPRRNGRTMAPPCSMRLKYEPHRLVSAIGITGTTGNLDPNNADSVQGVVYFCILYKTQAHTFTFQTNVSGMTRHEIKQLYAEQVFAELEMILTSSL